ncbi:MAG TPA: DUF2281 domain-containing protein [Clostridiales bacterium]|nr:DUF2281 domain-containing protein [Clostridiales bacterium]
MQDMTEKELAELVEYIVFLKTRRENDEFKDLLLASESSMKFWDNKTDDEVWNDV